MFIPVLAHVSLSYIPGVSCVQWGLCVLWEGWGWENWLQWENCHGLFWDVT